MSQPQGDVELFSEVLKAQTKSFYIDLKENSRGKYLKIAEKGRYRPKSSIVIPVSGLAPFLQLVHYYYLESQASRIGQARDIIVESKVFSFAAGTNDRGQYLRIFESGGGYASTPPSLMIPFGWSGSYLKMMCDSLERAAQRLSLDVTAILAHDLSSLTLEGGSGSGGGSHSDEAVLEIKESGPVLSVGGKHFFFELRSNERGGYLKVKEVAGSMKQLIVIPSHAVPKFQEALTAAMSGTAKQDQATPASSAGSK